MPTLDRALALAEGQHAALAVGEHLDLDVPRRDDRLLEVEPGIAERRLRLRGRGLERALELVGLAHEAHALAAAAGDGLEQHRVAGLVRGGAGLLERRRAIGARHDRDSRGDHLLLRGRLVAHARHRLGSRPDEHELVVEARLGEGRVLGEEAPARVDGLAARRRRRGDHRGNA